MIHQYGKMPIQYDIDISQNILLIPIQIPIVEWKIFRYKENNEILFITIIIMMNNDTDNYFNDI